MNNATTAKKLLKGGDDDIVIEAVLPVQQAPTSPRKRQTIQVVEREVSETKVTDTKDVNKERK